MVTLMISPPSSGLAQKRILTIKLWMPDFWANGMKPTEPILKIFFMILELETVPPPIILRKGMENSRSSTPTNKGGATEPLAKREPVSKDSLERNTFLAKVFHLS